MELSKYIPHTRFTVEVLKEATDILFSAVDKNRKYYLDVTLPEGSWSHDVLEEYFADYRRSKVDRGVYQVDAGSYRLRVQSLENHVLVQVQVPDNDRALVLKTFDVFEKNLLNCAVPPTVSKKKPIVFIGHGRSVLWRDLKDHLVDRHGYEVEAFESGARAGHQIRDILQSMMVKSSFALLVMTPEDETADGRWLARQNVVHETGLFQGKLGFDRAIVLLEDGCDDFSNINGIIQIRFSKGNIREAFGEVLATLRREFPTDV